MQIIVRSHIILRLKNSLVVIILYTLLTFISFLFVLLLSITGKEMEEKSDFQQELEERLHIGSQKEEMEGNGEKDEGNTYETL